MINKGTIIGAVVLAAAVLAVGLSGDKSPQLGASINQLKCDVTVVASSSVNANVSSTVLSANSRRAYARVEQLPNSVNKAFLSFDEGAAATVTSGLVLTVGTSSSPVPYIDFGLNTAFPYTGAVTGITDTSTTSLLVTECTY